MAAKFKSLPGQPLSCCTKALCFTSGVLIAYWTIIPLMRPRYERLAKKWQERDSMMEANLTQGTLPMANIKD